MGLVNRIGEPAATGSRRPALKQTGQAGEVWAIALTNLVFTILTLGIYRFWGVAKLRRYLWSHTEFQGEPLEYTGTGKEQFIGFLLALVLVGLPLGVLAGASQHFLLSGQTDLGMALQGLYMLALLFLPGFAIYRARRYRLSRTVWRGIRGAQTGSAVAYGLLWASTLLAVSGSFGLAWPWRSALLMRYKMRHTHFGNSAFSFTGSCKPLYRPFLAAYAVTLTALIASLGLPALSENQETASSLFIIAAIPLALIAAFAQYWYFSREWRYFISQTGLGGLAFSGNIPPLPLIGLIVGNFLLTLFTLGLGGPYAQLRTARFVCARLFIEGDQDFAEIAQSGEARPKQGEGLAAMFDSAEF